MTTSSLLDQLTGAGVSVWMDALDRGQLNDGTLSALMNGSAVTGVRSNPTIFDTALSATTAYADQLHELSRRRIAGPEAARLLTTRDVRSACDVLRLCSTGPEATIAMSPSRSIPVWAHDSAASLAEARDRAWMVHRPSVMIKIPATVDSLDAVSAAVTEGISINVTLVFSPDGYQAVQDAGPRPACLPAASGQLEAEPSRSRRSSAAALVRVDWNEGSPPGSGEVSRRPGHGRRDHHHAASNAGRRERPQRREAAAIGRSCRGRRGCDRGDSPRSASTSTTAQTVTSQRARPIRKILVRPADQDRNTTQLGRTGRRCKPPPKRLRWTNQMSDMSDDLGNDSGDEYVPGLLAPEESLDDEELGDDVDGPGYSPPDRPLESLGWGITAYEAGTHEPFARRLARELPDFGTDDPGDGLGDTSDTDGELIDDEVGYYRSGRLIWQPQDSTDPSSDLLATDVGIDGAAASAEEAAIHIIPDADYDGRL